MGTSRERELAIEKVSGFTPASSSFFFNLKVVMDIKEDKVRIGQVVLCRIVLKKKKKPAFGC